MKAYVMAGVLAVAFAVGAGIVWADTATTPPTTPPTAAPPAPAKGGEGMRSELAERLGLSPEQREQMRSVLQAARAEAEKATDPAAKRQIYEQAFEKIKTTVLNPEQQKKLAEVRENPGMRAHETLDRMGERLGLTADQKTQAQAILKAAHEEAEKAPDREAKAKIFHDAMEKIKTTVLTPDQQKKMGEGHEGPADRAKEMLSRMAERLGLTPDQVEKAKAILQTAHEQAEKAPDREAKAKIIREALEQIKTTILTDEQRTKMEAGREGAGAPGRHGPGAAQPQAK